MKYFIPGKIRSANCIFMLIWEGNVNKKGISLFSEYMYKYVWMRRRKSSPSPGCPPTVDFASRFAYDRPVFRIGYCRHSVAEHGIYRPVEGKEDRRGEKYCGKNHQGPLRVRGEEAGGGGRHPDRPDAHPGRHR